MQPTRRLFALPAVRRLVLACILLAAGVSALVVAQWAFAAAYVTAVLTHGRPPRELVGLLTAALAAWAVRAALLGVRDLVAARACARVRRDARAALARKLLRLGPDLLTGERVGELVTTATSGVAKLDGYLARLIPGAAFAGVVPPLLAAAVLVLDPPSGA